MVFHGPPDTQTVKLRLAQPSEPNALSVRDYLRQISNATGASDGNLMEELDRWCAIDVDADGEGVDRERRYLAEYDVSEEGMRARLEGFRQATGVVPAEFLELREAAQRRSSDRVWLPDLLIVPVVDERPAA